MSLSEKISADLAAAMKARESERAGTLRMIRSEILYAEKSGDGKPGDDEVAKILSRMARQRQESIEEYRKGDREDLAKKEEAELEIIKSYLPEEVSDAEIESAVDQAIGETGASSMQDMGKVMGKTMGALKATGKTIDGGKVNQIVKQKLSG